MILLAVFLVISGLFVLFLLLKSRFRRICAICLAIAAAWLALLAGYHAGWFDDGILLGLLMGQSITGIYYLVFRKLAEKWRLYRLPLLLTLMYISYASITLKLQVYVIVFVTALWLSALLIYSGKNNAKLNKIGKKLIECCKDW